MRTGNGISLPRRTMPWLSVTPSTPPQGLHWFGLCNTTPAARRHGASSRSSNSTQSAENPLANPQRFAVTPTSSAHNAAVFDVPVPSVALSGTELQCSARSAGYAKQLEQHSPSLFAEPCVRFPLASAHREQGFPRQAERFFIGFVRNRQHDAWYDCGQTELSLLTRNVEPDRRQGQIADATPTTKSRYFCVNAPGKPRLDGKLDDAVWRIAKPAELKSALRDDDNWPAIVMLAHDDEFLYLAISCQEAAGATYEAANTPRLRDGDLAAHDRVEIYLDIDRDYTTAYQLTIDSRGWTNDSCWGDSAWNPSWFVAAARSNQAGAGSTWTAEAAIPLSELSRGISPGNTIWTIGMQRIVPNVGFQSWNQPAAIEVRPEGFGLFVLE